MTDTPSFRSLIDLVEGEMLNELFKTGYHLQWVENRFGHPDRARFRTDDGLNYEISFLSSDSKSYTVNFDQGGNMHATGQGSAGQVFATVLQAIREFVAAAKPAKLKFTAMEASRAKLYKAMITKLISEFPDYQFLGQSQDDGTNFVIAKKGFLKRLMRR